MNFSIKGLLKRLKKIRDRDKEKFDFYPKRDWFIVVFLFILSSFVLMLFYRSLFVSDYSSPLEKSSLLVNAQEMSLENISKVRLNLILRKWEEKHVNFDNLLKNPPVFDFLQ